MPKNDQSLRIIKATRALLAEEDQQRLAKAARGLLLYEDCLSRPKAVIERKNIDAQE